MRIYEEENMAEEVNCALEYGAQKKNLAREREESLHYFNQHGLNNEEYCYSSSKAHVPSSC